MISRLFYLLTAASFALGACDVAPTEGESDIEQPITEPMPEACWKDIAAPKVVEASSDQAPKADPAEPPEVTRFEIPCADNLPADFTASLQRALSARALYSGAITGQMDANTRAAVRRYQQPDGIDSGTLSLAAARKLGLIAVERTAI